MARRHKPDHPFVWRAVVTRTYSNGTTQSTYCGPFSGKGHASGSASAEAAGGDSLVTIRIQRSSLNWEDVETREVPHD